MVRADQTTGNTAPGGAKAGRSSSPEYCVLASGPLIRRAAAADKP